MSDVAIGLGLLISFFFGSLWWFRYIEGKDKKILEAEYEKEKLQAEVDARDMPIGDVIERVSKRYGTRDD